MIQILLQPISRILPLVVGLFENTISNEKVDVVQRRVLRTLVDFGVFGGGELCISSVTLSGSGA